LISKLVLAKPSLLVEQGLASLLVQEMPSQALEQVESLA